MENPALMRKEFFHYQVDHFHEDQDDHHPLQGSTFPVLHDVFEKLEVFLDNHQSFFDIPEPDLQVKGVFDAHVHFIEILIFPGNIGRIEYI
jgi:hypothetical protein